MLILNLKRNSKPYKILRTVFLSSGLLAISVFNPLGGAVLAKDLMKYYFRKKRFEKEKFLRDLKNLQKRELINYKELANGEIKISLKKSGKDLDIVYNFDEIKLETHKNWDGKWRMVIFDIPNNKKKARDALRKKLRDLNFYPVQESVFITPYECEKEIDFICSVFDIRRYILIFYISSFEGENKLRHYFKI